MIKDNFTGTGSMTEFVAVVNSIASALNNVRVDMPSGYKGNPPSARIEKGVLVIDFSEVNFSYFMV
jgi:hypothetical protein